MSHAAIDTVEEALVWADHPGDCEQCDRDAVKVLADGVRRLRVDRDEARKERNEFHRLMRLAEEAANSFTPAMVRSWIEEDAFGDNDPLRLALIKRLEQEAKR
jgi:hypothetical protein